MLTLFTLDHSQLPEPVWVRKHNFCSSSTCSSKRKNSHCKLLNFLIFKVLLFISIFILFSFLLFGQEGGRKKRVSTDWLIGRYLGFGSYPERLDRYYHSLCMVTTRLRICLEELKGILAAAEMKIKKMSVSEEKCIWHLMLRHNTGNMQKRRKRCMHLQVMWICDKQVWHSVSAAA